MPPPSGIDTTPSEAAARRTRAWTARHTCGTPTAALVVRPEAAQAIRSPIPSRVGATAGPPHTRRTTRACSCRPRRGCLAAPNEDPVFSERHGGMIEPRGFSRTFDALRQAGRSAPDHRRLARHTCGTLLAFLTVHPKVARAILRHSRTSTTMDVCTHVVDDDRREAAAMLAGLLADPLLGRCRPEMSKAPNRNRLGAFALVGLTGFEPVASSLSGMRSNQLSYSPAALRADL